MKRVLLSVRTYIIFFLLMAFIITCCITLFTEMLRNSAGFVLTEENTRQAAILTLLNVILLSAICTAIDVVRRKFMVERPVKRITEAARRITEGDFTARIEEPDIFEAAGDFDEIIRCFNKMAEELSGVETLRTDFIANVSHELKTPLAVMQNYGALLCEPNLSEEKRLEYANAIGVQSRRLADLITNILKLNKLENQKIYPKKAKFNLSEQLCECLLNFESTWEKKNIEIKTDIEEEVFIRSDAELLTLVWNNLFSNALKFTEPKGTVSLSLKTDGGFAVVKVSDTGCGISPETGKHIFEKFYQGDTSHAAQGNGLGLALVRQVIDIVGAEVAVKSEVGKGSTFTVRIKRGEV